MKFYKQENSIKETFNWKSYTKEFTKYFLKSKTKKSDKYTFKKFKLRRNTCAISQGRNKSIFRIPGVNRLIENPYQVSDFRLQVDKQWY